MSVDQCTSFFVLAVSKVLWLHRVLAEVLDTLKVCNPFVHKLSLAVHLRLATLWQSLIMSMCHMRTEPRLV